MIFLSENHELFNEVHTFSYFKFKIISPWVSSILLLINNAVSMTNECLMNCFNYSSGWLSFVLFCVLIIGYKKVHVLTLIFL